MDVQIELQSSPRGEGPRIPLKNDEDGEERGKWTGRTAFILAAIGSAVGLGNFWRFPAQIYANGGATWFIPYFVCLFTIGIPMMLLEVTLGQIFQRGAVGSLGAINPCLRGVGYMAGGVSYLVTCYYSMILAYTLIYLVQSFYTNLPWSPSRDSSLSDACAVATQSNYAQYHFRRIIGTYMDDTCELVDLEELGAPIGTIVAGSLVTWILVYLSIFNGANATSKVVYLTVILPVLVIVALMIRTLSLDGASDGVYEYLAHWKFDELSDGSKWSAAVTQIFFTLSVGSGVMIAYGSFNDKKKPVLGDSFIISMGNFSISFLSGFVVFATVGYQAGQAGLTFEEFQNVADIGGPGLVFVTLPKALATLSQGSAQFFCILLFLMLFMLGLDSAFSLVESPAAIIDDLVQHRVSHRVTTGGLCILAFLIGVLFSTPQGFYLGVDNFDHFINNWGLMSVGIGQVLAVGWFLGFEKASERVGLRSAYVFAWTYWTACLVWVLISVTSGPAFRGDGWRAWYDENQSGSENGLQAVGFEAFLGFLLYSTILMAGWWYSWHISGLPATEWFEGLVFYGVEEFVEHVRYLGAGPEQDNETKKESAFQSFFLFSFKVLVKYVHPFLLPLFLCFEFRRDFDWAWPYGGYPHGYSLFAMIISASMMLFALGYGVYYSVFPEKYVRGPDEVTWKTVFT